MRLLIVEDEAIIAMCLQADLAQAGYEVCGIAVSGERAVELAQKESPDVVLIDIRLPGEIDGIEAARRIAHFLPATIIFTTGYPDPDMRARAMKLKPAAYLIKPVDIDQIDAVLAPLYKD